MQKGRHPSGLSPKSMFYKLQSPAQEFSNVSTMYLGVGESSSHTAEFRACSSRQKPETRKGLAHVFSANTLPNHLRKTELDLNAVQGKPEEQSSGLDRYPGADQQGLSTCRLPAHKPQNHRFPCGSSA